MTNELAATFANLSSRTIFKSVPPAARARRSPDLFSPPECYLLASVVLEVVVEANNTLCTAHALVHFPTSPSLHEPKYDSRAPFHNFLSG